MEEAAALAANLFMQPAVVRHTLGYLLSIHTPLDELGDGHRRTRLGELESDTQTLASALLRAPVEFEMRAQVGVLERRVDTAPRVLGMYHWLAAAFTVPDTVFIDAHFEQVVGLLGAMATDPERHWTNVTHGGLLGHVVAQGYRFPAALAAAYSPAYMVAVMVQLQLESLRTNIDAGQLRVHGALHMRAISAGLTSAAKAAHLDTQQAAIVARLASGLIASDDFEAALVSVQKLVAVMNGMALRGYAAAAARVSVT
jgi:hypothetical protein